MATASAYEKGKLYQITITDFTQKQLGDIAGKAKEAGEKNRTSPGEKA